MYVTKSPGRRGPHRWKTPKDMVWCLNKTIICGSIEEAVDKMFDAKDAQIETAEKAPTLWDVFSY